MKVIGIALSSFKGDKGETISGYNVYFSYPLWNGDGEGAQREWVSDRVMATAERFPVVGDEVDVLYNKGGKVRGLTFAK